MATNSLLDALLPGACHHTDHLVKDSETHPEISFTAGTALVQLDHPLVRTAITYPSLPFG